MRITSSSLSFQLVSSTSGWDARIYPRDAAPRFGEHASERGVLTCNKPDHVFAVGGTGDQAHAKNFHIVEPVGTIVTIMVERTVIGGMENVQPGNPVDQLNGMNYKVWYTKKDTGVRFEGGDGVEFNLSTKPRPARRGRWWSE